MKTLVAILFTALILAGGAAFHFQRDLDASRQQIADLQSQIEAMKTARQAAEASFAAQLKAAMDRPTSTAAAPELAFAPLPATRAVDPARVEAITSALREQIASPENQARTRTLRRAMLVQQYPDLGKELGLSEQEVNKLFDLFVQQETDLAANAFSADNRDPAAAQARIAKLQADRQANEAEVKAMLGGKYDQWQEYRDTLPGRRQVTDLRAVLSANGNSLGDAQARPLIVALTAEQKRINDERFASAAGGGNPLLVQSSPENVKRMVDAAAPYLNPQQLESFRQMREREANSRRALLGGLEGAAEQARARAADPP